jgi:hypothetical protein
VILSSWKQQLLTIAISIIPWNDSCCNLLSGLLLSLPASRAACLAAQLFFQLAQHFTAGG